MDPSLVEQKDQIDDIITTLKELLVEPPFSKHDLKLESLPENQIKRTRRKSKFTKEQDEMIIDLKRKGKSWVDIAEVTGVGSFLTARNRYQVLMGQQGVASTVWNPEDTRSLQMLIDQGELEKWRFISKELFKLTGKFFTDTQCRDLIKGLFLQNPEEFGVTSEGVEEMESKTNSRPTDKK